MDSSPAVAAPVSAPSAAAGSGPVPSEKSGLLSQVPAWGSYLYQNFLLPALSPNLATQWLSSPFSTDPSAATTTTSTTNAAQQQQQQPGDYFSSQWAGLSGSPTVSAVPPPPLPSQGQQAQQGQQNPFGSQPIGVDPKMWFQQQQQLQQQQQPSRATTYPLPFMSMPLSLPPSYGAASSPAQQLQAHQLAQLGQLGFPPSIATSLIAPMPGAGGGGMAMDMIDTVELTRTPESLPQSVGHSPVLASATVRPSLSSASASHHPHRAGGSSSHRNKRRHSTTTDEEEDAEGEPDDEVEVPEGVERDGMIWGMKVEDYRSLSARERKRVRNRISARTFRAKRKEHLSSLEHTLEAKDMAIKAANDEAARLRIEVRDLKRRLAKYE